MTKDEMKDRISMALKDPILQQGFEIICKNLAELESRNDKLVKWYNERSESDNSFQQSLYKNIVELEKENAELREKVERYYCLLEKSMDCETCKYCDLSDDRKEEPCKSCFFDSSKWELKE